MLIEELAVAYLAAARAYYRRADGSETSEPGTIAQVLDILVAEAGSVQAHDFGPKWLKRVRDAMIRKGWARVHVNKQTSRIKTMFRWAVEEEIVPPSVHDALKCVRGLRRFQTEAPERDRVLPVSGADVERVLPFLKTPVRSLVRLQWHTGARGGELFGMRACDLRMKGDVWRYELTEHKTAHHGHARVILIGPKAQEAIRPFLLGRPVGRPLFSPRDAYLETGKSRCPSWIGDRYTRYSYRNAVNRACVQAGVKPWHPHQLRHAAATAIREAFGVEAAKTILGQRTLTMAELYAERSQKLAADVIRKIG